MVNSVLQPTLGLRWLLCYEESDRDLCHLQKAAPCEWFAPGKRIAVDRCPTRWGEVTWATEATTTGWIVTVTVGPSFAADLLVHLHPPDRRALRHSSAGILQGNAVLLKPEQLREQRVELRVD